MTRIDLQNRLINFFQNNTYYTPNDWTNMIQDGLDEVCAFTGCIFGSVEIPFTANKSYYDMITLIPNYLGVYAIFNPAIKRWLIPTSIKKIDCVRIDWETALGVPYYFVPVSHRYVALYKKPGDSGYGNMYVFYMGAAPILNDTTTIPIPDDHIQALENYCLTDAQEMNQEWTKASSNLQAYSASLESLRVYMRSKRNSDRQVSLR